MTKKCAYDGDEIENEDGSIEVREFRADGTGKVCDYYCRKACYFSRYKLEKSRSAKPRGGI